MSESLNKISSSVSNLSELFFKVANLIKEAQRTAVQEIGQELLDREKREYKSIFEKQKNLAENIIYLYYNRIPLLTKEIKYSMEARQEENKKLKLRGAPELPIVSPECKNFKKERAIIEKSIRQLKIYSLICDNFIDAKSLDDIKGLGNFANIICELEKGGKELSKVHSEDWGEVSANEDSPEDSLLKRAMLVLGKFLSQKIEMASLDKDLDRIQRIYGVSKSSSSSINNKINKLNEDIDEAEEADNGDYFAEYKLGHEGLNEAKYSLFEEIDQAKSVEIADEADSFAAGGGAGAKGKPPESFETRFKNLKEKNNERIKENEKELRSLLEKLKKSSASEVEHQMLLRSKVLKEKKIDFLKKSDEILNEQIRIGKVLDALLLKPDAEPAKVKQELDQLRASKKEILEKARQVTFVDPLTSIRKAHLSSDFAQVKLERDTSPIARQFKSLQEKLVEYRNNPQNYSGIVDGDNVTLFSKFKLLFDKVKSVLNADIQNTGFSWTSGTVRISGNPIDRAYFYPVSIDELVKISNSLEDKKRDSPRDIWTKSLKIQNSIISSASKYNSGSDKDKKAAQQAFDQQKELAKQIADLPNFKFLTKRVKDRINLFKDADIQTLADQIKNDPYQNLVLNILRYLYERAESDVSQNLRNNLTEVARSFLKNKPEQKEKITEFFDILYQKNKENYISYRAEIYMEMCVETILDLVNSTSTPEELTALKLPGSTWTIGKDIGPLISTTYNLETYFKKMIEGIVADFENKFPTNIPRTTPFTGLVGQGFPTMRSRKYNELVNEISDAVFEKYKDRCYEDFWSKLDVTRMTQFSKQSVYLKDIKKSVTEMLQSIKSTVSTNLLMPYASIELDKKINLLDLINSPSFIEAKNNIKEKTSLLKILGQLPKGIFDNKLSELLGDSNKKGAIEILKEKLKSDISSGTGAPAVAEGEKKTPSLATLKFFMKKNVEKNQEIQNIFNQTIDSIIRPALIDPAKKDNLKKLFSKETGTIYAPKTKTEEMHDQLFRILKGIYSQKSDEDFEKIFEIFQQIAFETIKNKLTEKGLLT